MPLPLSTTVISEKNKLNASSAFLLALSIQIPGVTAPFRVVRNTANIVWRTYTWGAIDFQLEEIREDAKGEVPRVEARISNISRTMETYLQQYDAYTKANGYSPIVVTAYVLNTADLANDTPVTEHEFELVKPRTDARWAYFTLGASNPFDRRYPVHRIMKDHCKFGDPISTLYGFKGPLCKYAGGEAWCDRTLVRCRQLGNALNFGGNPGVGRGGLRLAQTTPPT